MAVDTTRREYTQALDGWKRCRDVYQGGDVVRMAADTYLPRLHAQQRDPDYIPYLKRALFYPTMARTVAGLAGAVFRKEPDVVCPESVEPHLEDVSLTDLPLTGFGIDLFTELLVTGRYGVLVDMPVDGIGRPYWVAFTAEQIVNWRTSRIGGNTVVTLVVLKESREEFADGDTFTARLFTQYRVLELIKGVYTVTIWRKPVQADGSEGRDYLPGETTTPTRRGQPLDFIPFNFFGPSSVSADIEKPPLLDLADVNLSHYRSSADLEHARHWVATPTLVITGYKPTRTVPSETGGLVAEGDAIKFGSAAAISFEDPAAKAYILEVSGDGIPSLERALDAKERMMAILGARLLEDQPAAAETAYAVSMRHAGEHAVLRTMAKAVSIGLSKVLWWHVWMLWPSLTEQVPMDAALVTLNTEFFDVPMSSDDVRTQIDAVVSGSMSYETFYFNLTRGGLTRPGVDAAEERETIAEEQAEARTKDDQRLAAVAQARAEASPNPPLPFVRDEDVAPVAEDRQRKGEIADDVADKDNRAERCAGHGHD